MDEDQKFFDVLRSLNRDGLIDLIEAAVSVGPEFIDNSVDLDIQELDKLGERAGRILELKSGKVVRKGLDQASLWRRVRNEMNKLLCTKDKKYASVRRSFPKRVALRTQLLSA